MRNVSIAAAILLAGGAAGLPQQANQRVAQFENAEVSVWRSVVVPNGPLVMHTHQHPRVIIPLVDGDIKIAREDGTSESHHWEKGKAYWLSAEEGKPRHADLNTGTKPIELMVVELKNAQ
jgi:hypothetical protein